MQRKGNSRWTTSSAGVVCKSKLQSRCLTKFQKTTADTESVARSKGVL